MKKIIFSIGIVFLLALIANAQEQDPKKLHESAKTFIRQGDYSNAVLVLNRLLKNDANNLELLKDLAFAYYLNKDYARALETAKPFEERKDTDVQA